MKKRWLILSGILAVLLIAGWISVPYIEASLQSSLDSLEMERKIQEELQTSTGLRITYQGKRFELLHGLILTGARLEKNKNGTWEPIAEFRNLVLDISYFRWFTGAAPLQSIRSYSGNLYSGEVLSDRSGNLLDQLRQFLITRNISINLQNVAWIASRYSADAGIRANIELSPGSENTLDLDFRFHGNTGEIRFHGSLNEERRRIFVSLSSVPLKLLTDFIAAVESAPNLSVLPEWSAVKGEINGKGSMDLRQEGTATNLKGSFQDLTMEGREPLELDMRNLEGSYHFSQVFSYADGVLQTKLDLDAGDALKSELDYERQKTGLPHSLRIRGRIKLTDNHSLEPGQSGITVDLIRCSGEVDYDVGLTYDDKLYRIQVSPEVKAKNLQFLPPQSWPGSPGPLANLNFDLDRKTGHLSGSGEFLESRVSLEGDLQFELARIAEGNRLRLIQKGSYNIGVSDLSYRALTGLVLNTHTWILERASRPDARKAEDRGPLWENEFIDMPLYTQLLAGLQVKGIATLQLKDGPGLPSRATVRFSSEPRSFNASLNEDNGMPGTLRGRYMGVWNEQLPTHTLSLTVNQKDLNLQWPGILEGGGPSFLSIEANYSSNGIYPADLINYSNGQTYFKAHHFNLKAFAPYELGLKMLGQKVPSGPAFADVEVVRSGTGQDIDYYRIVLESEDFVARGGGTYSIYEGGRTWLNVAIDGRQDKLNFQIQKNGKWLPDDGL